jgi:hypothetical protein
MIEMLGVLGAVALYTSAAIQLGRFLHRQDERMKRHKGELERRMKRADWRTAAEMPPGTLAFDVAAGRQEEKQEQEERGTCSS